MVLQLRSQSPQVLSRVRVLALGVAMSGLGISSCSRTPTSATKHDLDAPVRDAGAWNWNASSDADYQTYIAPLLGLGADAIMATDDPVVQRAQFWLDQVDQLVRSKHPAELAAVPKPLAKVLRSNVPNAFVAPMPTCVEVPVALGGPLSSGRVFVNVKNGVLAPWPEQLKCKPSKPGPMAVKTVREFAASFNKTSTNGCRFSVNQDGALQPNASCKKDPSLAGVGGASGLVLMKTANFVTVHAGILPLMNEPAFVSVLAHELGHYYRSHVTSPDGAYDYFYTLEEAEPGHRPTPEADKAELGKAAVAASALLANGETFAKVEGQALRSELYPVVGSLVVSLGSASNAAPACSDAATFLTSPEYNDVMRTFPLLSSLSPEQKAQYKDYEDRSLRCLATASFTAHGAIRSGSVGFDTIKALAAAPEWPAWQQSVTEASQAKLSQVNQLIASRLGTRAPQGATADAAVAALSQLLTSQETASTSVLDQVHAAHLGQYTVEQEADDESAEWLAALGIDPEAGVDSMRSLGNSLPVLAKAAQVGTLFGNLSQTACDQLWRSKWLGADGNYTFVSLGDLTDPHHSICYRMFNIEREIKAHALAAAPVSVPEASGESWEEIQRQAQTTASLAASALVSPLLTATGAMSCQYNMTAFYKP